MQRRMAVLGRALFVPLAIVVGALAVVSPSAGETSVALMPLIGSGTHPVEASLDSWGVGNG
ncbi:hypothetical protein ACIBSW_21045 [Actinoplanes sp. NPDC049668]|uniref:hypothetical protein n=1 Tax=unclassified Actinoplanes TaxID=2626549 RepID=UPI0033BF5E05